MIASRFGFELRSSLPTWVVAVALSFACLGTAEAADDKDQNRRARPEQMRSVPALQGQPLPSARRPLVYPKFDSSLNRVLEANDPEYLGGDMGFRAVNGQIQIAITAKEGALAPIVAFLEEIDANNILTFGTKIRADVDKSSLTVIHDHPDILAARRPYYLPPGALPIPDKTSTLAIMTSEGVAAMNADAWHQTGFTGQGLKIGVIDIGFAGPSSLIGTELPPADRLYYARFSSSPSSSAHGTACAEIVYDLAPDAEIYMAPKLSDFGA